MSLKKPLVLNAGQIEQLQSGDTLDANISEVDVVSMSNGEASSITICQAVYVSDANEVGLGKADAAGTAKLLGLVQATSIEAAASGSIQTDGILSATTGQWDAVTGETGGLTANSTYYLSAATGGDLTSTPPSTGYVVRVGLAISTTEMDISIENPIKL
jgi:hypothetical protein